MKKDWEIFEETVQIMLGLDSTIASGAKFHDIGDAVERAHHSEKRLRLMVDCKSTVKPSYRLESSMLDDWREKAGERGFVFALPVQMTRQDGQKSDWVVVNLRDFSEIVTDDEARQRFDTVTEKFSLDDAIEGVDNILNNLSTNEEETMRGPLLEVIDNIQDALIGLQKKGVLAE